MTSEKTNGNPEIDKVLDYVMSNELVPHTIQLFEHGPSKRMKPYASGVLAILNNKHYILTASHVVENWSDEHQLYVRHRKGYVSIVGTTSSTVIEKTEKVDLAYILLEEEVVKFLIDGYKFLPISKFRRHIDLLDAAQYCVVGFPEVNQWHDEKGVLRTGTTAYFMQPSKNNVYEYLKLKKENHICLEFKGVGKDIKTGEKKKIKGDHYGLSGCGLWLILLSKTESNYSYDFRLIGIMTDFRRSKFDCLFGNHIELLLKGLKAFKLLDYQEIPIEI